MWSFPLEPEISGIYELYCECSDKRYIGSSVDILRRKNGHLKDLKEHNHCNTYLQRAWDKYGETQFVFTPLLYCDKENLIFFEQRAINIFNTTNRQHGFNICPVAGSRLGTKISKESRQRISKSRKGKCSGKENHNYGKSLPQDTKDKISESLVGKFSGKNSFSYGRVHSDEAKKKISLAGIGQAPWNKGLTADQDDRIKKYADTQTGKTISEEKKKRISNSLKGHKVSDETKKKLSEAQTKRWGTYKARKQQSERLKGRTLGMKGKQHSEETKQKMRDAHKKRGINHVS